MTSWDEKLTNIAAELKKGVAPPPETVRNILGWFGADRRGYRVVHWIRRSFEKHSLTTSPDFGNVYIDGQVRFTIAMPNSSGSEVEADPTYRLARLEAANRPPLAVKPDSTLQHAVTQMMVNDYSQLPVMTGPRDVKGIISWKSIGMRLSLQRPCTTVRDCIDTAHVLRSDDSLFSALELIRSHDYVLVQANDKTICGIVTASDVNVQFLMLAEPFLLVGEIENGMRLLLHGKFTVKELESAKAPGDERAIEALADLSLGEYIRLIEPEDRWKRLRIGVDRAEFVSRLHKVREIRNDVMHFDPDGLDSGDMVALREFAGLLRRLREIGIG